MILGKCLLTILELLGYLPITNYFRLFHSITASNPETRAVT